jgi:hypothetical protein
LDIFQQCIRCCDRKIHFARQLGDEGCCVVVALVFAAQVFVITNPKKQNDND